MPPIACCVVGLVFAGFIVGNAKFRIAFAGKLAPLRVEIARLDRMVAVIFSQNGRRRIVLGKLGMFRRRKHLRMFDRFRMFGHCPMLARFQIEVDEMFRSVGLLPVGLARYRGLPRGRGMFQIDRLLAVRAVIGLQEMFVRRAASGPRHVPDALRVSLRMAASPCIAISVWTVSPPCMAVVAPASGPRISNAGGTWSRAMRSEYCSLHNGQRTQTEWSSVAGSETCR